MSVLHDPARNQGLEAARDRSVREALEDRGYRVVAIRHAEPLAAQVARLPEVFGSVEAAV